MSSARDESWWHGRLQRSSASHDYPSVLTVAQTTSSGADAFQAILSSGEVYWIKAMGNGQGDVALINELVVGRIADLLGACVRPHQIVMLPDELCRERLKPPSRLRPISGPAHGSLHLDNAVEVYEEFQHRDRDNNAEREVGIYALWDLCLGKDEQWLYDSAADFSVWSFDHSLWFGVESTEWDQPMCRALVDVPWGVNEADYPVDNLSASTFHTYAQKLRDITPADLLAILAAVPTEWGKSDRDLEVLGWMLYRRSRGVAQRLVDLASRARP